MSNISGITFNIALYCEFSSVSDKNPYNLCLISMNANQLDYVCVYVCVCLLKTLRPHLHYIMRYHCRRLSRSWVVFKFELTRTSEFGNPSLFLTSPSFTNSDVSAIFVLHKYLNKSIIVQRFANVIYIINFAMSVVRKYRL